MNLLTKAAAGTVGAAGASVVGCYAGGIIKFGGEGETSNVAPTQTISWEPLTKDAGFDTSYSDATWVGKMYGRYLVGVGAKNEKWWEESYKRYEQDGKTGLSTEFGSSDKVTSAYSTSENKALNKVCESVYKKGTNLISFELGSDNKHKLGRDLLKYCSPLEEKPTTLETDNNDYGTNTIGKTKGADKKLVKAKGNDNKGFWEAQQKWLKETGDSVTDQYFSQSFQGEESNKKLKDNKNIRDICDGAYGKQESSTSSPNAPTTDDVVKYCTFATATQ